MKTMAVRPQVAGRSALTLASTISRYLLGLMFTVFGANGFLHFIKMPPPSTVFAAQFHAATNDSHFMVAIFALQLLAGLLLLADRYVALALIVLAGILTNILLYHVTMDPAGIPPGIVGAILWVVTALNFRGNFRGILSPTAEPLPG